MSHFEVRLATRADEDGVIAMGKIVHAEVGKFAWNEFKVRKMIRRATDRTGGILGVIGEPGNVLGSVFILLDEPWYSDDWNLVEMWNFVHPEHRNSSYAQQQIKFAKGVAKMMGLKLSVGLFNNVRLEAKEKLYSRYLRPAGVFYMYDPNDEEEEHAMAASVRQTVQLPRGSYHKLVKRAKKENCEVNELIVRSVESTPCTWDDATKRYVPVQANGHM